MRTRTYGGVRGRKTKVGRRPTFVFLLLDFYVIIPTRLLQMVSVRGRSRRGSHSEPQRGFGL